MIGGIGTDSNIYVIDGEVVVDTGSGEFFNQAKEEISKIDPHVRLIINTHAHYDHTGGNKKFRDWLKAEIAIHSKDKEALETGKGTLSHMFNSKARTITVDKVLRGGNVIKTQNFSFEVISTPGHTPGSICLYEKHKKILISGDTLFAEGVGRTDLPGGDFMQLYDSLKRLSGLQINYLLPGHGKPKIGGVNFFIKRMLVSMERDMNEKSAIQQR